MKKRKPKEGEVLPHLGDVNGRTSDLPTDMRFARRTLAAAMVAVGRAADPQKAFLDNKDVILTSLILLGREDEARTLAARYGLSLDQVTDSTKK